MGGGGGILGDVTSFLFGKPAKPTEPPLPEAPAPPAPTAKTDTGAIIQTGALDSTDDRVSGRISGSSAIRRSSTLGSLGKGGW